MRFSTLSLSALALMVAKAHGRFVIYADEWHDAHPSTPQDRAGIDHIILAFATANATASYQPKVPIATIRQEFPGASVMIAVGGWGDDVGWQTISQSDTAIYQFAGDVATMLKNTGADGVDIDWEYPGGNGADYKQVPNEQKKIQIDAYPKVLAALRSSIANKILSIAVPGRKDDMMAFTNETGPKIWPSVDFINVMSYDLANRRDNLTYHHTSVKGSEDAVKNYMAIGAPAEQINLGFAYYAKYFATQGDCAPSPLNCPIVLAEDPITGKDTLTSGAWTFEKSHMASVDASNLPISSDGTCGAEKGTKCASGCCSQYGNCGTSPEHCSGACQHAFCTGCIDADVAGSWQLAAKNGVADEQAGGQYYFDPQNHLFWTWDSPEFISRKFDEIVRKYKLGGVMAWSLGEDSYDWSHIRLMACELQKGNASSDACPAERQSHTMLPADPPVSEETQPTATKVAILSQVVPSNTAVSPQEQYAAPDPSPIPADTSAGYSTVYVNGSEKGPDGEYGYSSSPSSPPDFAISAPHKFEIKNQALPQPNPVPESLSQPLPAAQMADFTPDPGYVNPNWHGPLHKRAKMLAERM